MFIILSRFGTIFNVFEAEVQKLEADQFHLGTCTHWYYLMSYLTIAIR
jgi:hypothetical protein